MATLEITSPKHVGKGVCEIRIQKGAGLRIYYGIKNKEVIVLISGGDKSTQKRDIPNEVHFVTN